MTIRSQSYSATNWQQEVCHFKNALNSASYFYSICFKLHQNNVKTRPIQNYWGDINIYNIVAMATCQTWTLFSVDFEADNMSPTDTRHQTRYIYCSYQVGQLSNLQSLATTNRKSAILIWISIFDSVWWVYVCWEKLRLYRSNSRDWEGGVSLSFTFKSVKNTNK